MNSPVQTVSREMKDSGVEWIGEIPKEWGVCPLLAFANERKNKNSSLEVDNLLSLSYGKIIKKDINSTEGLLPESYSGYNIVEQGDIVIRPTDLQNDKRSLRSAIVEERGIITSAYIALQPSKKVLPRYCHYLLRAYDTCKVFYNLGSGVRQSLNYKEFSKLPVLEVSIAEQQRIANYLDRKCGQIDAIIEKQKLVIEKLKAYKLSVITEAVTKGLDPNVKMKDSGVEWIGMIPKVWDTAKTLYALSMPITDGPHETPELFDEGIPFVSAEAVSCGNGRIDFDHIRGFISHAFYEECCKKYIPRMNDIYMIKSGATTGKVAVVDTEAIFTIWSPLAVLRANKERCFYRYLFYFLQSDTYQKQIQTKWSYGTQQNIGMRTLESLLVCLPPVLEQKEIAHFLDQKCVAIDSAIAKKENLITKLTAYKKSLIYELVTGKQAV